MHIKIQYYFYTTFIKQWDELHQNSYSQSSVSSISTNIIKLSCLTEIYNLLSVQHIVVYDYDYE